MDFFQGTVETGMTLETIGFVFPSKHAILLKIFVSTNSRISGHVNSGPEPLLADDYL
jgi:hypothetical protein